VTRKQIKWFGRGTIPEGSVPSNQGRSMVESYSKKKELKNRNRFVGMVLRGEGGGLINDRH